MVLVLAPWLAAWVVRALGATWRYEDVFGTGGTRGDLIAGPTVFVFWHRSLLACAYRFRGLGIAILISRSFDGELIARTVERLGFTAVRGSSTRGAAAGLKGMADAYQAGRICAITADGPRGPAMVAKAGGVQVAQLVQADWIGAFDAVPERAWVLKTWDRFLIPKPFSTVRFSWPQHAEVEQAAMQARLDEATKLLRQQSRED
jgi:lysophospholipid acyltransferase (LPLAT)-like uncharacterized protein